MAGTYSLILRSCSESHRSVVAQLLGRAFSLKESTCVSIASSTPIVLLGELSREEAGALSLAMMPLLNRGAGIEFSTNHVEDLPKIDWPNRPMIFKREIAEHVSDCQFTLPLPAGAKPTTLLELLMARLAQQSARPVTGHVARNASEFRGAPLPEITPFSNPVLTPPPVPSMPGTAPERGESDAVSRLNELFPEDEVGFMPNNDDITSILNRLLPDEDHGGAPGSGSNPGILPSIPAANATPQPATTNPGTGSSRFGASPGHSVFLAKITDDGRRAKVVSLLEELAGLSREEAESLSKKVIIPVLRGVSKEAAEAAKQRFAKIGILARVKAPES